MQEAVRLNLGVHLRNTPEIKALLKLCCALPLLPEEDIELGYRVIVLEAMNEGRAIYRLFKPFLMYLATYWITSEKRLRWMSVHGSFHRTNNASESHNKVLLNTLGVHANIYQFIRKYSP